MDVVCEREEEGGGGGAEGDETIGNCFLGN